MKLRCHRAILICLCSTVLFASSRNREVVPLLRHSNHRPAQYTKNYFHNHLSAPVLPQTYAYNKWGRQDIPATLPSELGIPLQNNLGQNDTYLNAKMISEDNSTVLSTLERPLLSNFEAGIFDYNKNLADFNNNFTENSEAEEEFEEFEISDLAEDKKGKLKNKKKKKKSKYKGQNQRPNPYGQQQQNPHHPGSGPPDYSVLPVVPVLYLIPEEELDPYLNQDGYTHDDEEDEEEHEPTSTTTLAPFTIADVKVPAPFIRIEFMICFCVLGVMYGFGFLVLFQTILVPVAKIAVVLGYIMLLKNNLIEPVTLEQALAQLPPT